MNVPSVNETRDRLPQQRQEDKMQWINMEVVANIKNTIFLHLAEKETNNIDGYIDQINVNKSDTYCKTLRKWLINDLQTAPHSLSIGWS